VSPENLGFLWRINAEKKRKKEKREKRGTCLSVSEVQQPRLSFAQVE